MTPVHIMSGELLSGIDGLISAVFLTRPVADKILSRCEFSVALSKFSIKEKTNDPKKLKELYENVETISFSMGLLLESLAIIFLKNVSFTTFFLGMIIPCLCGYIAYPKALYRVTPTKELPTKQDRFGSERKSGFSLMFVGGLITLGTAYYQDSYYGVHNFKGMLLGIAGSSLVTMSMYYLLRKNLW